VRTYGLFLCTGLVTFYFHSTDGATVAIRFSVTVYGYGLSRVRVRVSVRVTVRVSVSVSIINVR